MTGFSLVLVIFLGVALLAMFGLWRQQKRSAFIRETPLPPGLLDALASSFPRLTLKDRQLVARGLRKFFLAQVRAGQLPVAMPSRVVGALWQALGKHTDYARYCRQAFGRVLPVTAPVALSSAAASNAALRRCWWHCCREETIDPRRPTRLPLLFALDRKLRIVDGFHYFTDAYARQRLIDDAGSADHGVWVIVHERSWTAEDFLDHAYDGTTDGFGGDGSDGGGDGGGD